jgi:hypothetical protein
VSNFEDYIEKNFLSLESYFNFSISDFRSFVITAVALHIRFMTKGTGIIFTHWKRFSSHEVLQNYWWVIGKHAATEYAQGNNGRCISVEE